MESPVRLSGRLTAFRVRDGPEAWPWAELEPVAERLADNDRPGDLVEACGLVNLVEECRRNLDGKLPGPDICCVLHVRSSGQGSEAGSSTRSRRPPVLPVARQHETSSAGFPPVHFPPLGFPWGPSGEL